VIRNARLFYSIYISIYSIQREAYNLLRLFRNWNPSRKNYPEFRFAMIYDRWLKKNNNDDDDDDSANDIEPVEECAIEMIPEIEKLSVSQKFQIFLNPSIYL
jgi:hypothetical protein